MTDTQYVSLAHGNGGRFMRELIKDIFAAHLASERLDVTADAASLDFSRSNGHAALEELGAASLMMTTDGFTVQPLEFPGGDIGSLAVNGTVNDLAVSGAVPRYLSLSAFIEEGLEVAALTRIVKSMGRAARQAHVQIVTGDTKVVPRGHGGGLYFTTTGIGVRHPGLALGIGRVRVGDVILVSGPIGDHGVSVMLAREAFDLKGDVRSDCGNVTRLAQALFDLDGLRFMRDPTRGGLATVAHEIAELRKCQVRLLEDKVPVRPPVRSVCEMLGYDPYYLACEGRVVAVVAREAADKALAAWRAFPEGAGAQIVGHIEDGPPRAVLETELGGTRVLEELEDDPLPRIC